MTGRMASKVVVVTGGARGQGAAHGQLLAQEGACVVLADVRDNDGNATAARLQAEGLIVTYAREGIRVNTVVPGSVQTQFGPDQPLRIRSNTVEMTPLGRRAEPLEISYAVLYLASDESTFVTGSDLVVDGGYLAQ